MFKTKQVLIPRNADRIDEKFDKLIDGQISGEPVKSDLIDIDRAITEEKIDQTKWIDYEGFVNLALKRVEASNKLVQKEGYSEIQVLPVTNVDRGDNLFDLPGKRLPKYSFLIGNTKNPVVKILVIGGKHGGETRLIRPLLEGLLEIAKPGNARKKLLEKALILFDLSEDPWGIYNQTRGAVTRTGRRVNAPIVGGGFWAGQGLKNPWAVGDRNSAMGRNSLETQDELTRSNRAHYFKVLGRKADWVYDAHETCEGTHYPDVAFTYGGILFMAHLYVSDTQLGTLNQLEPCVGGWKKLVKFFNDRNPLANLKFREEVLYHNPRMEKIRRIINRVRQLGQRTQEEKFDRAIAFIPMVERDIRIDESVYIGGMMFRVPGILLGPDVLGYEGNTTESFQQDLVVRAKQTIASLEAQLQVIGLGYKPQNEKGGQ